MPGFSLDTGPRHFTMALRSDTNAPLPRTHKVYVRDFGSELEPRYIVRAGSLDQ